MNNRDFEKKKREDLVIGIVLAAIAGFILNLFANLYYDLFFVHSVKWANVNKPQIIGAALALLALTGFLQFFVEDFRNNLEINKSLLKRFSEYFFYDFKPGRVIRVTVGIFILVVLAMFLLMLYFFVALVGGYFVANGLAVLIGVRVYLEEHPDKQNKIRVYILVAYNFAVNLLKSFWNSGGKI